MRKNVKRSMGDLGPKASEMNLLITGGTGTFGNAFIPEALACGRYSRIAIFSRDEAKQHHMQQRWAHEKRLRWLIGDVRDYDRLRFAFEGVNHVVQAAALKHVPSGERNPGEHIATNVMGAQNVVMAAATAGVAKVMAVSTDKAVEPINLYGATKLCMERLFMAANNLGRPTKFSACRYGNVIGSRGSFIETLAKLRDSGAKTYPLRSPQSTRFWIRPDEAARFVLSRLEDMAGAEIFVPKMESSSVVDFARSVWPEGEPELVGVPSAEKIHETLISANESQYTEERDGYFVIRPHGERKIEGQWSYTSNRQVAIA